MDMMSVDGVDWMRHDISGIAGEYDPVHAVYGPDLKSVQIKAERYGASLPTVNDFERLIFSMPGDSMFEKYTNARVLF